MPIERYYRDTNGLPTTYEPNREIPDNDPGHLQILGRGAVEISKADYDAILVAQAYSYNSKIEAEADFKPLLNPQRLSEHNNLTEVLLDSATEILAAREALDALNHSILTYQKSNPAIATNIQSQPDGKIIGNIEIRPASRRIRSQIGAVANHAQIALDYIAWGFVLKAFGGPPPDADFGKSKRIGFPFFIQNPLDPATPRKIRDSMETKTRFTDGWMSQDGLDLLISDQPYHREHRPQDHPLWRLNLIANRHKHRRLTVVESAVPLLLASNSGKAGIMFGGGSVKNNDIFDFTNMVGDENSDINFQAFTDISIDRVSDVVDLGCVGGVGGGNIGAGFHLGSTANVVLHKVIWWVEQKWVECEQRPHLFLNS